jgi:hypothetical protein
MIEDILAIGKSATGAITDIVGKFAKDSVPNYPIKSGKTFDKIKSDVNGRYPFPRDVQQAQQLLTAIKQDRAGLGSNASGKTYMMMFDEIIPQYERFIAANGSLNAYVPAGAATEAQIAVQGGMDQSTYGQSSLLDVLGLGNVKRAINDAGDTAGRAKKVAGIMQWAIPAAVALIAGILIKLLFFPSRGRA